jgi:hypothetical protein
MRLDCRSSMRKKRPFLRPSLIIRKDKAAACTARYFLHPNISWTPLLSFRARMPTVSAVVANLRTSSQVSDMLVMCKFNAISMTLTQLLTTSKKCLPGVPSTEWDWQICTQLPVSSTPSNNCRHTNSSVWTAKHFPIILSCLILLCIHHVIPLLFFYEGEARMQRRSEPRGASVMAPFPADSCLRQQSNNTWIRRFRQHTIIHENGCKQWHLTQ